MAIIRELASRKLKSVVEIPWAQPAVVVVQPFTSYLAPEQFKNPGLTRQLLIQPEFVFQTVPFTAYLELKQLKNPGLNRNLISILELDRFAPTPAPEQPPTAFLEPVQHTRHEKRTFIQVLELNERPEPVISPALLPAFIQRPLPPMVLTRFVNVNLLMFTSEVQAVLNPWTEQPDSVTTWSDQSDSSTTWTDQADSYTTWTEQ